MGKQCYTSKTKNHRLGQSCLTSISNLSSRCTFMQNIENKGFITCNSSIQIKGFSP